MRVILRKIPKILMALAFVAACASLTSPSAKAEGRPPPFGFPLAEGVFATALAAGPDGNIWFTAGSVLGKLTPAGEVTEYTLAMPSTAAIVRGPEGDLWFTQENGIGRTTTAGEVTSFPLPEEKSRPSAIAVGPDGNFWFTERTASRIGRISTGGTITEFPLPKGSLPNGIVAGPENVLWFTERGSPRVGRITTGGEISEFRVPGSVVKLSSIALGPDGNIWFGNEAKPQVGRITPSGKITMFPVPTEVGTRSLLAGPDGRIWFASGFEVGAISPVGAISWPACLTEHCLVPPNALAFAADGSLWIGAGVGHCPGYCGGGTEISYQFDPGGAGPYSLPPLTLAMGPRLAPLRNRRTSATVACGHKTGCQGVLRLDFARYRKGKRHFVVVARSRYALEAGEARRITLRISQANIDSFGSQKVYLTLTAGRTGKVEAKRVVTLVFDKH
jgi:streptogramin lyase